MQDSIEGKMGNSSACVLLCRYMQDMCEKVIRARGLDECPETEPGGDILTMALNSMHDACPVLDLTCHGSSLVEEIFRCADADTDAVPRLIQAIAGVDVLKEMGVSPSNLALHVALHEIRCSSGTDAKLASIL